MALSDVPDPREVAELRPVAEVSVEVPVVPAPSDTFTIAPANVPAAAELDAAGPSLQVQIVPAPVSVCPVAMYAATLGSSRSQETAYDSARRVARALGLGQHRDAWRLVPWGQMGSIETTAVRSRLLDHYSPSTVNLTLSILKGILKQAWRAGMMSTDQYTRAVDLPNVMSGSISRGRMLNDDEIAALRAYLDRRDDARLAAIFACGLGAGLRRDEIGKLLEDCLREDGTKLHIIGKGAKEALQPVPYWATRSLNAWAQARPKHPYFFCGITGGEIYVMMSSAGRAAGIPHFSPHDLRRTFASFMLATVDVGTVQRLMRHASVESTMTYDRRGPQAAETAVQALDAWGEGRPLYVRKSEPLDMAWARGQVVAMRKAKWPLERMLAGLMGAGVKRTDGRALSVEEIKAWSV